MDDRAKDVTNYEKPTPPPLRELKDGAVPKRRGRPPKVRPIEPVKLPAGIVKAGDIVTGRVDDRLRDGLPVHIPACDIPQPCPGGTLPTVSLSEDRIVKIHAPTPLLTLHLRRVGVEITDGSGTVHIPVSGAIPDGTKLVAHFYREA